MHDERSLPQRLDRLAEWRTIPSRVRKLPLGDGAAPAERPAAAGAGGEPDAREAGSRHSDPRDGPDQRVDRRIEAERDSLEDKSPIGPAGSSPQQNDSPGREPGSAATGKKSPLCVMLDTTDAPEER